jgi:hypothetical protein
METTLDNSIDKLIRALYRMGPVDVTPNERDVIMNLLSFVDIF